MSNIMDVIGALIGLARSTEGNEHLVSESTDLIMLEALCAANTKQDTNSEYLTDLLDRIKEEKKKLVPDCFYCQSPCGRTRDYDMQQLWEAEEDIRLVKLSILSGIEEMSRDAYQAALQGHTNRETNRFFYKALYAIGSYWDVEELHQVAMEMKEIKQ